MKNLLLYRAIKNAVFTAAFLIAVFSFSNLPAQTVVTVPSNNDVDFDNAPFDIADDNYVGSGDIYQSTEIAVSGTITAIEWDNFSCPVITLPSVKIYLKLVPTTTTTWATETYATALTGATLVYSGSYTSSANNWANQVTLTTPFNYTTGNNLEIITESDYGSTNQNEPTWYSTTTVANSDCSWFSATQAGLQTISNSSGGIDQYRPAVRLTIIPCTGSPAITGFSPTEACAGSGTTITVNGSNFVSGFTSATVNGTAAVVTFVNTGQITLTLPAGASGTGNISVTTCSSATSTATFTVDALPAIVTNPSAAAQYICIRGTATALTVVASGAGITYQWFQNSVNNNTSGTLITGATGSSYTPSTSAAGTTYYYCVVSGTCAPAATSNTSGAIVIENPTSTPGAITGPDSVCANIANTFSIAAVSGATSYTWTLPGGWTGTSAINSIQATANATGGAISVTADNACGNSSASTLNVSVVPVPATPGAITGPNSICSSSINIYSVAPVNHALSYTWTLPATWTGSSTTDSIQATAGASGGNVTVTAHGYCGNSQAQTLPVTVSPAPATPGTITGPASVCPLASNTYSVTAVNGATSYSWSLPNGWSGTSTTNSITATQGAGGGTISVTANNGCGSSTASTLAITVSSAPTTPMAIIGPDSVCSNSTNTFSVAAVTGATSYAWTLPGGWSGTSTTSSISATEGTGPGTISVTADNACGNSTAQTLAVSIASAPATPGVISRTSAICTGDLDTFSVAAVAGATTYNWTLPGTWTGTSTTNSLVSSIGHSNGNVTVSAQNACGTSNAATLAVTSASAPATPGIISQTNSVCSASADTFSIAAVSGATYYTWTLPGGWSGSSTASSINATAGSTGGTVSVTANNTCGNSSAQTLSVSLASGPGMPGTISQTGNVCAGSADTFSIAAVNGASGYSWTLPGGWSGSSTSVSITGIAGTAGGTVSVTANNGCGSSTPQTLTVSLAAVPSMPGTISQSGTVCTGSPDTFSIAAITGANSYTWTLPNGWTGSSTTLSINSIAGIGGGTVSVTANNTCGSSVAQTLAVSLGAAPPVPAVILQSSNVCTGGADTFSVAAVTGATSYTWTLPTGWSGSSTTLSINSTAGSGGGTVSVTANNTCGSSAAQTLAVTLATAPATPGSIFGNDSVCALSTGTYGVFSVSGATSYTWTLPNGWTGASDSAIISATANSSGGIITVTANNTCGSSPAQTMSLGIEAPPATPGPISGPDSVCAGSSLVTYLVPFVNHIPAYSYNWTLPAGWADATTQSSITPTIGSAGGTISVTAQNACGVSPAQMLAVTVVAAAPSTPGAISQSGNACAGSADTLSVAAVSGATSYTWTLPNGWSGTSDTLNIDAIAGNTGGTVSVTANNACGSSPAQTTTVSSGAVPATPGTISGADSVCAGSSSNQYGIFSVSGATSYIWDLPSGWSGSSTAQTITTDAGTTGGTISVKANNSCGSSAAQILSVVVKAAPQVQFTFPRSPVCNNENPTVALNSGTPAGGNYSGQGVAGSTFDASALNPGTYTITYSVTNSAGCTGSDTSTVVVEICEGVANMAAQQISVYPNPFNDAIIVNTQGNYGNGVATLTDVTGREINRTAFEAGAMSVQINTPSLAKGAYLLQIIVEGKLITTKKLVRVE